jgi:asparagine synthase (glutamine-hydrolysing)
MCGIVGIVDSHNPVLTGDINAMRACIWHRGPDAGGAFTAQTTTFSVGLGSQRLSILDLSAAGTMPMPNEDRSIWIVYNGEIYNHLEIRANLVRKGYPYRSQTDTETVLHAYEEYGADCFALFNGIFACIIYDGRKEQIVIARDRSGVKPLYYVEAAGKLVCASELKALVQTGIVPTDIDPEALEVYLALGYVPAPYALIRCVRKLPAGTYGISAGGRLRTVRYWQPSSSLLAAPRRTWAQTVAETRSTVAAAVARQMMSDVPVGVMLSGGLDSTIVAALAQATSSEPLHTFSIGFETRHSEHEPIYNLDRDYARRVAGALGTVHHEIVADDSAGLEERLRSLVAQLDEPVWEPSFLSIYLMSTLARENGVKVLLSGDGSDELFGGYPWHPALVRLENIERVPGLRPLLGLLAHAPLPGMTGAKVRDLQRKYRRSDVAKYHAQYDIFDSELRARMFGRTSLRDPLDGLVAPLFKGGGSTSLAGRFAVMELMLWVGEHFNQRLDRMTMAASVEGRVPFQDNAVIDLALAMSFADKLRGGRGKAPLRAAFAAEVPSFVIERPKRPFAAPAMAWMHGALRPLVLQALDRDSLARLPGLDPDVALVPLERFRKGLPVRQEQIWTLLHLALWVDSLKSSAVLAGPARATVVHAFDTAPAWEV